MALAKGLHDSNVRLLGSGGTAKKIREAGIPIESACCILDLWLSDLLSCVGMSPILPRPPKCWVAESKHSIRPFTEVDFGHFEAALSFFLIPPMLGILARDIPSDSDDLKAHNISYISIVVCNLYPFTSTISKPNCTLADAVEDIDIGGVTLLRAAAKNHARVSALSDPADYAEFLEAWIKGSGDVGQKLRNRLALKAFEVTAQYDSAISGYFMEQYASAELEQDKLAGPVQRIALRYGANPHQKPAQAFVTEGKLPFEGIFYMVLLYPSYFLTLGVQFFVARRDTSTSSTPSIPMRL